MFGSIIDYYLLRPLTHSRNIATEEQLDSHARADVFFDAESAGLRLEKLINRFEGTFRVNAESSYLDIGCGVGDIPIALAIHGAKKVAGIDIIPRNIEAARLFAKKAGVKKVTEFICADINSWEPPHPYQVVISHEALEHIENPRPFLARIARFVEPAGSAVLAFGPLFHSPFGDHMRSFFRCQLPWRGLLFSEKAIMRLRQERFRPTDPAGGFRDFKGGLNLMRFSEFLRFAEETGWRPEFITVNPQLKKYPPLYTLSNALVRVPFIKDYVASSVYTILRRRA